MTCIAPVSHLFSVFIERRKNSSRNARTDFSNPVCPFVNGVVEYDLSGRGDILGVACMVLHLWLKH
jgi:hypothetical protein